MKLLFRTFHLVQLQICVQFQQRILEKNSIEYRYKSTTSLQFSILFVWAWFQTEVIIAIYLASNFSACSYNCQRLFSLFACRWQISRNNFKRRKVFIWSDILSFVLKIRSDFGSFSLFLQARAALISLEVFSSTVARFQITHDWKSLKWPLPAFVHVSYRDNCAYHMAVSRRF